MNSDEILDTVFGSSAAETAILIHVDGSRETVSLDDERYDVEPRPSDTALEPSHQWSLWPDANGKLVWVPVPRDESELVDA